MFHIIVNLEFWIKSLWEKELNYKNLNGGELFKMLFYEWIENKKFIVIEVIILFYYNSFSVGGKDTCHWGGHYGA